MKWNGREPEALLLWVVISCQSPTTTPHASPPPFTPLPTPSIKADWNDNCHIKRRAVRFTNILFHVYYIFVMQEFDPQI